MVAAKPVVCGIDLGASESYVAYVGKGIVDIVQNEVSKRATSTLVGFTDRERLLGDAALAQIRSNAKNTCRGFKHLLGRKLDAPDVEIEKFWSTSELTTCEDGFAGYSVSYKGDARQMMATQCTAMYLTHLKENTEKWCQAKVQDVVIAVPSSFSDTQRQAVQDAARIAGLSVLRVMNEHTATALAYGIYRSNDFDPEQPMTVAFCSMGHSIFSVSIVQFVRGKLRVISEKSDKVGGRDMDECLMREFAAQFKKKVGCDPLSNKKASFKLEDAVTKTKKILSANSEANLSVECLMEDEDFHSQMTREDFEKMCSPMMDRVKAVLQGAIESAQLELSQIDSVEMVGGGSRVPWVKRLCSQAFGKDLSTTMNQEESVARGCALQAAMLSPLYKVRDFEVKDVSPFGVGLRWTDGATAELGRMMPLFPAGSAMDMVKMLSFYRTGPFKLQAEFLPEAPLPPGTERGLGTYQVDVPAQTEAKKVKVKAKLSMHGTFLIDAAQIVEEEEYEETVKEWRELPEEEEEAMEPKAEEPQKPKAEEPMAEEPKEEAKAEEPKAEPTNGDAPKEEDQDKPKDEEKKAEEEETPMEVDAKEDKPAEPEKKEPRYEWVSVVKKRKRLRRTDLQISVSGKPGLSDEMMQKRQDEETAMQADMREIIETDERRNDLESYIFTTRNKVQGEWADFVVPSDLAPFLESLQKAEDWLYDNFDATKIQYIDKLDELRGVGDPIQRRHKEFGTREEWVTALLGTIGNYRKVAQNPGEKYGHIAAAKLEKILSACTELETWLQEKKTQQDGLPKHQKPVLTTGEMDKRNQELAKLCDDILKEPKEIREPKEKRARKEKGDKGDKAEKGQNGEDVHAEANMEEDGAEDESKEEEPEQAKGDEPQEVHDNPQNMDVD
ncbi:HSP70-14 [Symbiodinium natans]|uniref:HSP70-14 protein n=1 Tax=Symbiodinium natans TaxID=878477 RepID=A0A812NA77_9DINO|nr:HSP70-14 [Symbiodinium natans]